MTGVLLGGVSPVRRPGVAIPGLLGGLIVGLVWLALSGFTFLDQILPDIVHWHQWVDLIVVPFVVGAAGTVAVIVPLEVRLLRRHRTKPPPRRLRQGSPALPRRTTAPARFNETHTSSDGAGQPILKCPRAGSFFAGNRTAGDGKI